MKVRGFKAQGFEKVLLRDKKWILTPKNNFKLMKFEQGKVTTRYKKGTVVEKFINNQGYIKHIQQTNGTDYLKIANNDGSYKLFKSTKNNIQTQLTKEKTKNGIVAKTFDLITEKNKIIAKGINKTRQNFMALVQNLKVTHKA